MSNNHSRIENSIKNVKYTAIAQAMNFVIVFISRRIFIKILSAEYLGLNGVFSSVISMLALAELGIGTAICFCLYKPIYNADEKKINSIMLFYKKAYTLIGTIVFLVGTALIPFLNFVIQELPDIKHIRLIYFLFVVNSAASYFFVYKKTLLIADQKQYIANLIHQLTILVTNILQIAFLIITHNYFSYLIIMIACTLGQNIFVSVIVDKRYPYLDMKHAEPLDKELKKEIFKNVRAMAYHRLGGVVVNGTDNLIIARAVSVISAGLYSNYFLIKNTIMSVINILFQSITSSVGNLGAEGHNEKRKEEVFEALYLIGAIIIGYCSICLYILFNPFIEWWVGKEYLFDMKIVTIIVINFYMLGLRTPVLTVRDALGIFWYDRYKPMAEAIVNLVTSILLVFKFGISGVFIGTLISTITTSFWVEPYVLYKHGFNSKCIRYFTKYILYALVTVGTGALCYYVCSFVNVKFGIILVILKGLICTVISGIIFLLVYANTKEFKLIFEIIKKKLFLRR